MSTEDPAQSAAHAGGTASDIPIEPQSLEWMRRLVAIPSISGTSNLGVIELTRRNSRATGTPVSAPITRIRPRESVGYRTRS